MEREMLECL